VTGELFSGKPASQLSLGDAFQVGFGMLARPGFILPILLVTVIAGAIIEATLLPATNAFRTPGSLPTAGELEALLAALATSSAAWLVVGLLTSVYGQIWVLAATAGPLPTIGATLGLARSRWPRLVAVQLALSVPTIALVAGVTGLVVAAHNPSVLVLAFVALPPYVWFTSRLAMAAWLAADGGGVGESLRGSWAMTRGKVGRVFGGTLATAFAFGLLTSIIGTLLGVVPLLSSGVAQGLQIALTYGALVTLYRRVQADAMPPGVPVEVVLDPEAGERTAS
jgi:hypothetical protein